MVSRIARVALDDDLRLFGGGFVRIDALAARYMDAQAHLATPGGVNSASAFLKPRRVAGARRCWPAAVAFALDFLDRHAAPADSISLLLRGR